MNTEPDNKKHSSFSSASTMHDETVKLAELRLPDRYDNAPDSIKNQIIHEQAYGLFAVLRYAAINTLTLSSLTVFVLWTSVPHAILIGWFALTNVISLGRHLVYIQFTRTMPSGAALRVWLHRILLGTVLITLSWCALVGITWSANDPSTIAFVAFILAAVAFGSFAGLGLYVKAYLSAAGPLFVALAILFGHWAHGSTLLTALVVLVILIIGTGMITSSLNASHVWRNSLVLLHEHQDLAREHREKSAVLSTTLHSIDDGILTLDHSGLITYINPAAERLMARTLDTVVGTHLRDSLILKDEAADGAAVELDLQRLQPHKSIDLPGELVLTLENAALVAVEVTISPLHTAAESISGYVVTLHDVTSLRLLARDLSHQALHDPLTGLLNRRGFEARVHEALERKRSGTIEHCLCVIDLDLFKTINDACGHQAGDELLQQVVSEIQTCIRDSDSFGRMGGDEFAILLYGCSLDKAQKIAQDACAKVASYRFQWNDKSFPIGASIGLTTMIKNDTFENLMHAADGACYRAKENGRGQVCVEMRTAPST